jgi:hypothetical protein
MKISHIKKVILAIAAAALFIVPVSIITLQSINTKTAKAYDYNYGCKLNQTYSYTQKRCILSSDCKGCVKNSINSCPVRYYDETSNSYVCDLNQTNMFDNFSKDKNTTEYYTTSTCTIYDYGSYCNDSYLPTYPNCNPDYVLIGNDCVYASTIDVPYPNQSYQNNRDYFTNDDNIVYSIPYDYEYNKSNSFEAWTTSEVY